MKFLRRLRDRIAFWRWYLTEFRPMAGADDGTVPDPDTNPDPAPDPTPDPAPDPAPDPDPSPPEPQIPEGKTLVDEAEYNRYKRRVAEADKAERDRKRKAEEEAGNHHEVVKSVEGELATEKSEREKVEGNMSALELSITVRDVAGRLGFIDPADAQLHLPSGTPNDPQAVERALKKIAEEKKYLIGGQGSRTGAPGGGGDPSQAPDIDEQIRKAEEARDVPLSTRLKRQKFAQSQQG